MRTGDQVIVEWFGRDFAGVIHQGPVAPDPHYFVLVHELEYVSRIHPCRIRLVDDPDDWYAAEVERMKDRGPA